MSRPALSARGLFKSFGSLVVASDIELTLPAGARYALIGPNGAGKTTLINLMTGMLRPDAGRILLDGADITALPPEQRVKRGLVRTFQINALFPHLTALESVTLAVCERRAPCAHGGARSAPTGTRSTRPMTSCSAVAHRRLSSADPRACLWAAAPPGNRARHGDAAEGLAARRAGCRRAA